MCVRLPVCIRCLFLHTNLGPDAVSSTLSSPTDSQATAARQRPDGPSDKLGGSRQVVRRASTTEEVTLMKGHHGAKRLWRTRCMYRHPLPFFSCSHGQNGQLTVSPKPCALSARTELHTEQGNLLLKKLSQGAGAMELMVDIRPPCRGTSHRTSLQARGRPATGLRTSSFSASCDARGPGRQNHESAVAVPLRPGARDRPAGGARSRGRLVPIEGVLFLIALLRRWRPDDEDRKQLLLVDGTTRPARLDPTIHTPHEPPLDVHCKRSGEDRCVRMTRGARPRRVLRGQRGWRRGRQGIPLSLLTQEARDGGCPQRSTGRRARRQESRGVATTDSRTTFASRPTKVPAPPRERMCDTGHDDPGLQPADLLRRHHRTAGNPRHSNQNRGRCAPNAHRAEEQCPADLLLGAPGVGCYLKTCVRGGVTAEARGKQPCICP